MSIPALTNQEVNGLLRSTPGASSLVCVIGCSSQGTTQSLWLGSRITDLVNTWGYGPAPELAAVKAAAGKQVALIRVPTVTAAVAGSVTFTGTGTSVVSVTGTPYNAYSVKMLVVVGGTIASAGIKIQYSLNGGSDYSPIYYLGTGNTFLIPNTGITLNFGAGTLVAGDTAVFTTTAPAPDISGIQAAMDVVKLSALPIDCMAFACDATASILQAIDSRLVGMKPYGKHCWALTMWPGKTVGQSDSAYTTAVNTAISGVSSDKIGMTTWSSAFTSALTGLTQEKPVLYSAFDILTPSVISENAAAIAGHAVPTLLVDNTGNTIYHDALYDESLSDRTITLRSWPNQPGVYITRARLMSAPADSAQLIIHRRLVNRGEQLADAYFATIVNTPVRAAADGTIAPDEALRIQTGMTAALEDGLASDASKVAYLIDKTINILTTSRIEGDLYIQPFGYPETIITRIALTATIQTAEG